MLRSARNRLSCAFTLALTLAAIGCGGDDSKNEPQEADFESALPGASGFGRSATDAGMALGPEANADGDDVGSGDAARAIEEADIIKLEGQRLYALSRYGGLNVIDVGQRDAMRLLGRKKVQAEPFEMYVRDSMVFALYNGFGEYEETDEGWAWTMTSTVVVFDTTRPDSIEITGTYDIPGYISDSRIVGDILYVVGFQDGYCWDCQPEEQTTVISLDVSRPDAITKVDEVAFDDDSQREYSWRRSITVTPERMYVAGPEWGDNGPLGSTIQVLDISDPAGSMQLGTTVTVAGQVNSRWQMDEYEGVLRVISQSGEWRPTDPPRLETFQVDSADQLSPLGSLDLVIPANEDLRSARFDGPRGYAITALQTDPLFALDLSDPTAPRQAGALEMPGWVYHMEPRGNRVVALGYDQGNGAGGLTVSLFEVSDLDAPTMLDRVNFGEEWAYIYEDQDRVHKAFQVLDEDELVLMPFEGWGGEDQECSRGTYQSGVQLIDWSADELVLRGVASVEGSARRGFLHDDRLFAVSDARVETFDISDRNAPQRTDSLQLALMVERTVVSGDKVVRVTSNWWTQGLELDVTTVPRVEASEPLGRLELPVEEEGCESASYLEGVFADGDRVYAVYRNYTWQADAKNDSLRILTVDISDPAKPQGIGDALIDVQGEGSIYYLFPALAGSSETMALVNGQLAVLTTETEYPESDGLPRTRGSVQIIGLADPTSPRVTSVDLPNAIGYTGFVTDGDLVGLGHILQSPTNPDRFRFYFDRIDVPKSGRPSRREPLNVPGAPLVLDSDKGRLATVDYVAIETPDIKNQDCYDKYANSSWEPNEAGSWDEDSRGTCSALRQSLRVVSLGEEHAILEDSFDLAPDESINQVAYGNDRLFVTLGGSGHRGYAVGMAVGGDIGYVYSTFEETELEMLTLSGVAKGKLEAGRLTLNGGDYWSYAPIVAQGTRALVATGWRGKLAVVDASTVAKPTLVREEALLGRAQDLSVAGNIGIAAMGSDGVQAIPMGD